MNVLTPHDPGFDEVRTGYQQYTKHEPALIVTATSAQDVVDAVARGEPVAVQSSGHGLAAPMTGGVLIATRGLAGVRVDPAAGTAFIEAGANWQQVIDAAAPHGRAPLSGSAPGV